MRLPLGKSEPRLRNKSGSQEPRDTVNRRSPDSTHDFDHFISPPKVMHSTCSGRDKSEENECESVAHYLNTLLVLTPLICFAPCIQKPYFRPTIH